jgi:hypothetical protein
MRIIVALFVASAIATPQCTTEERAVWIGSDEFSENYRKASASSFGDAAKTTDKLAKIYPISRSCLACLGTATECSRDNCMMECAADPSTAKCLGCIDTYCISALLECTGAESKAELPNPAKKPQSRIMRGFSSS